MRLQSEAPLLHRPGVDVVVQMFASPANGLVYPRYVRQTDNQFNFVRVHTEGDFDAAEIVGEGAVIDYQNFDTPYVRDYPFYKRGLGFSISKEAMKSAEAASKYLSDRAMKMGDAIRKAKEADIANYMNLATSTAAPNAAVTPDALSVASAAHLRDGGTFSNVLTGNSPLSVTALAQAVQELISQVSHTGDPMMFMGPYKLLVPPALADLANRLVKTQKLPTTGDNDINWAGSFVDEVIVNPYFTSTTAWALVVSGAKNPLTMVNKVVLDTDEDKDIDTYGQKFTAVAIWTKIPKDPRGFIYSAGA
jgi:hypothetical protein